MVENDINIILDIEHDFQQENIEVNYSYYSHYYDCYQFKFLFDGITIYVNGRCGATIWEISSESRINRHVVSWTGYSCVGPYTSYKSNINTVHDPMEHIETTTDFKTILNFLKKLDSSK